MALLLGLFIGGPLRGADGGEARSPLDRLKQRSAAARWEEVRSQWTSVPDEAPVVRAPSGTGEDTLASPLNSAPPWADENQQQAERPDAAVPAIMSSGSQLSRSAHRQQSVDASTPTDPEAVDWFFGPADPLSQQRAGEDAGNRAATNDQMVSERPVTLPEFLKLQQPVFDEAFGRTRVVAAFDEGPNLVQKALRPPPQYVGLRPITSIQPFRQYDPKGGDPCEHLCPPPGNCPADKDHLCPDEYSLPASSSAERLFAHMDYYWLPSNVYHNPLYFQNPALERYGHVHYCDCVEPFFSVGRFGAQLVSLPYQMALFPVCRHEYPLGWYRPGDFAPKKIYQVPLNGRAAATAAGVYAGLFWLVP